MRYFKMNQEDRQAMMTEIEQLRHQNTVLKTKHHQSLLYIRDKVNQLLGVVGTIPLKPEELDDNTLLELDPIGIVSDAFAQIIDHLRVTNLRLRETHDELQAIFDSASVGIVLIDPNFRILTYNSQAAKQIFRGIDSVGKSCDEGLCHQFCLTDHCLVSQVKASGRRCTSNSIVLKNHQYDVVATPILDNNGDVSRIVTVFTDITERIRSEAALRESEKRLRNLFENTTNLILIVSTNGQIQYVNQTCCNTLRYEQEELYALAIQDIIAPQEKYTIRRQLRMILKSKGQEHHVSTVLQINDGSLVEVEGSIGCQMVDGKPVAFRAILRNVTIQHRMELEMSRTQKLESVGILAGGIAHDFNNLLAAILSNITLARFDLPAENKVNKRLLEGEKAVVRAQHLTQQLLTFSKGGMPVVQDVSIVRLLHDSVRFSLSGSNVESIFSIPGNLWQVKADPGQIDQVIQNLVINSDQAMPDGGKIQISCQNVTISEADRVPLAAGIYVCITIADQGQGISPDMQQKIFDPYFTTKKHGIGLGLFTSYAIVQKHQGHITVQSEMGVGTTFQVYLPAVCQQVDTGKPPEETPVSGSGKILVMDDEEMIRETTAELLNFLGYQVDTAIDGEEAVSLYRQAMDSGDPYQVVIMDLTVPGGMGGVDTMAALQKLDPEVNGISTSGYSDDPVMANYTDYGFKAVLPKPCKINVMAQTIQSLLTR